MKNYFILLFTLTAFLSAVAQEGLHTRDMELPCIDKNFNVYLHVSVDSTSRQPVLSTTEMETLMEDVSKYFEPLCISFTNCEINIIRNYTFYRIVNQDRLRELEILYGKPRRLNVYIVGSIPQASCGFSTYNGIARAGGESIFIELDDLECAETLEMQLAHHLGHFLGLRDTYYEADDETLKIVDDPDCAVTGDGLCDTPVDPFGLYEASPAGRYTNNVLPEQVPMSAFVRGCEFIHEERDPNGRYYQPQTGNIMSAYPCKCGFTNGQFLRMFENYTKSEYKPY
mgnify:CR=1 FL=1